MIMITTMYCICYKFEQFKPKLQSDMQFLLIGYGGTEPEALDRRMIVRGEHLEIQPFRLAIVKK